jgi:diguanylate cyclase (GGDEF)-like protein/putative nucleotidyltransferase with HDIG domain
MPELTLDSTPVSCYDFPALGEKPSFWSVGEVDVYNSRISILCVDKNKSLAEETEGILKKDLRGASFVFAENSETALDHLKEHPVDLVLVGHHAQKFDGFSVMDHMRKKKVDTAVIMITSEGNEQTAVEAMKRGAYDYISKKELNAPRLRAAIKEALSQKRREIRNREADERIKEQATQDGLTGLYNHIHFQQLLEKEFRKARRYGYPLYCILVDLDDFKVINDTYGHPFGDRVLEKCAEILRKQMRDIEILARYGGEEFVVACSHIKEDGVLSLCERLREIFSQHTFEHGDESIKMTVSIGLSSISGPGVNDKADLIRHADEALYEAKNRGKNNVCRWSEKHSLDKLISQGQEKKIAFYQKKFSGLTQEILAQCSEYSKSIVEKIEKRDRKTNQHSPNVTRYAEALAKFKKLPEVEVNSIRLAAMLHDIGKVGIEPEILYKKTKYTAREYRIMKLHPIFGIKVLEAFSFLDAEMQIILQHHERFDGKGYPTGRKGRDINRGARIIALCDAYDAILSGRSYKKGRSRTEACRAISRESGKQFDPELTQAFLKMIEEDPRISAKAQ